MPSGLSDKYNTVVLAFTTIPKIEMCHSCYSEQFKLRVKSKEFSDIFNLNFAQAFVPLMGKTKLNPLFLREDPR